jgi:hypothetical protein
MVRNTKDSTKKILELLTIHNEFPQALMAKKDQKGKTSLSNKTVIENLKRLRNQGLIINRPEQSKQGGKDKNFWSLTYKGLFHVLLNNPDKTELILRKHSNMLLFAQKLTLFETAGVKEEVLAAFRVILSQMMRSFFIDGIGSKNPYPENEELQEMFDAALFKGLLLHVYLLGDKAGAFLIECKKDDTISKFFSHTLESEARQYEGILKIKKAWEAIKL